MNVLMDQMTVLIMPPALTLREVMSALVILDSLEMDSTAQVRLENISSLQYFNTISFCTDRY